MSADNYGKSTTKSDHSWPATRSQQHYVLINELRPKDSHLNCHIALRIEQAEKNRLINCVQSTISATSAINIAFKRDGATLSAHQIQALDAIHTAQVFSQPESIDEITKMVCEPFDLSVNGFRSGVISEPSAVTLILCAHRAICDRQSLILLAQDIASRYCNAAIEERVSPNVIATSQIELDANAHDKLAAISNAISNSNEFLDIPSAKSRPSNQSHAGAELSRLIDPILDKKLTKFATRHSFDRRTIWLAAWACVISRYSTQQRFCIGATFSGRNHNNTDKWIGPLEESLPIAFDLPRDYSFTEALKSVSTSYENTAKVEGVSLGSVLDTLSPTRSTAYHPLFQIGFSHQQSHSPNFGEDIGVLSTDIHHCGSTLDLSLSIVESESSKNTASGAVVKIEFATDLFEHDAIQRMLGHLVTILESAIQDPTATWSTLQMLTDTESEQILKTWNDTTTALPNAKSLHKLFEAQAKRTPDRVAVECDNTKLTYKELDSSANRLANFFRTNGVGPNVLVSVCLDRSTSMLVSLLGIMKAGGGYVPIDPGYPPDRIQYMAEHSNAAWIVTNSSLRSRLPNSQAKVFCIDERSAELSDYPDTAPDDIGSPQDIAYVIYTSGSTGQPKGVQVPQVAAANFIASMAKQPGMSEDDVLVAVTTLSFDIAVLELYLPISVGARTIIASREVSADGGRLLSLLKQSGATILQATPSTWQLLISAGLDSTRLTALCGGEAMPRSLASKLINRTKTLWNMYGPTETTVWSTCFQVTDADSLILIGRPIDNTQTYVLDESLQPVPVGLPGELYIGGTGVTRGYLHRDDLTNARFISNPFDKDNLSLLYRTGDSVRYKPNGNLEYLDRLDNQVKVRGFRIELGEIEASIAKHTSILENVVIVREDQPGDKRLVCYYTTQDKDTTDRDLRQHVQANLPAYMVPQHFVLLDSLPQTPNGKVDRKALPALSNSKEEEANYDIPSDLNALLPPDWIFEPDYTISPLSSDIVPAEYGKWLILMDDVGVSERIAAQLEALSHEVIRVHSADQYSKLNDNEYCLNPEYGRRHFSQLAHDLENCGQLPNRVLHAFLLTGEERYRPGSSLFHRNQEHGFQSLLHLIRELRNHSETGSLHTTVVTNGAQSVAGEQLRYPDKATAIGAVTVLGATKPGQSASAVDIDFPPKPAKNILSPAFLKYRRRIIATANRLLTEILAPANNQIVAYRRNRRYTMNYVRRAESARTSSNLSAARICLITNGISKFGVALASRLGSAPDSHIVLVDKYALTDPRIWRNVASGDSKLSTIAQRLLKLQDSGISISVADADVADAEAMRRVFDNTHDTTGRKIDTVYHLALDVAGKRKLDDSKSSLESDVDAQIHGTRVLQSILNKHDTKLYLVSNLAHIISADNDIASAAGAAYMQALAIQNNFSDVTNTSFIACPEPNTEQGESTHKSSLLSQRTPIEKLNHHARSCAPSIDELLESLERTISGSLKPVHLISNIDVTAYRDELVRIGSRESRSEWVAPRNDIELTLANIWKRILGINEVSVTDNFFEIGGHSLTAVQLFGEINSQYNTEWPLAVLFESPTIESCAIRISETLEGKTTDPGSEMRYVVALHSGPKNVTRTPIFVVAGAFGNVLNLRHLAQLLGKDRPVYGIQARGLSGQDRPHESFSEMARDYIKEIREVQESGPYILGGFCSGGTAAFEMTRQLNDAGESVSHLIMLDTTSPGWNEPALSFQEKVRMHMERLGREGLKYPMQWLKTRYRWEKQQLHRRRMRDSGTQTNSALFRSAAIFEATERAENRYAPEIYNGKTILLRPRLDRCHVFGAQRAINKDRAFVRDDNGWSEHLPQLIIEEVAADPGDHDGFVLEPAVRNLVTHLREFIDDE